MEKLTLEKAKETNPFCELCFERGIIVPTEVERRRKDGRYSNTS